jgi:hypothetical protein
MMLPDDSLGALLAAELELRDLLLDACIADDRRESPGGITFVRVDMAVGDLPLVHVAPGQMWPCGAALDELRLVERRIHQIKEALRG